MDKVYSMLGLGIKARSLRPGETACKEAIKKRKCNCVIIAEDASFNTKKKFKNLCDNYDIECLVFGNKYKLGNSIGKGVISSIAVCDYNLGKAIKDLIKYHL
ncbi:MAG: 50S ribosomal protein L7ae [Firmicutes bacterium]|nr:50S ribosomal protein L7ae [Bacillota bacterium]